MTIENLFGPQPMRESDFVIEEEVNEWIFMDGVYSPALNTKKEKELPPGFYTVGVDQGRFFAIKEDLQMDEIFELPNQGIKTIVDELTSFWSKKELYKKHNIVHKRGILLVGEPGNGKTSTINVLCKKVIDDGGIIFHISNIQELDMTATFVRTYVKQIQPDVNIIFVIEDIDGLVNSNIGGEHLVLSFLDGENQLENTVVVATSNRHHELNDLLLRPSRFDWIIEVEAPNEDARRMYFQKKNISEDVLEDFVEQTDGLTMADLKEVFIATQLLDYSLEAVITKLKDQSDGVMVKVGRKKLDKMGF